MLLVLVQGFGFIVISHHLLLQHERHRKTRNLDLRTNGTMGNEMGKGSSTNGLTIAPRRVAATTNRLL